MTDEEGRTTLILQAPGQIDGDPQEVEDAVLSSLIDIAGTLHSYAEEGAVQLRNSYLSRVLTSEPSVTPAELNERWEESDAKAGIDRVLVLAEAVKVHARHLAEADL